ncbi:MAG: DEAD/DEAH box helicase [Armatimonadota bacterium]
MSYQDKVCTCRDCEREFVFSAQEQKDFQKQGFNPPTRCAECHQKRNARRRHSRGGDCGTHVALCAKCGKEAQVPFKPSDSKPVYCDECFKEQLAAKIKPNLKHFVLRKPDIPTQETTAPAGNDSFGGFGLDARLERAVREAGFDAPTPVQSAAIPIAIDGRDIIGTAQTGTGKTAAFVLPILQHLLDNPVDKPRTRAIVLTPTRELAEQIHQSFKQLGKHTKIKSATVYGGVGMNPQENALKKGVEVIVACPGRLLDHMERGNTNFSNVEKLVLDEADRMLDMGFLPSIKRILARLPRNRQSMLFSATFAPELTQLASETLNAPERVDVDICAPAKTVAHALYPCPQHLKTSLVLKLLDNTDTNSVLIFTRTKHRANRVAQQIERAGYGAAALHSNKSQNQRQAALDDFRSGRCQILVATDIAARGLDVDSISHVINYDIPDTADTYIHRIGRTGRAEREGDAMTLITKEDAAVVWDIERALGSPIERKTVDDFDYSARPAVSNEFKRGPIQQRRPKPNAPRTFAARKKHAAR